MKRWGLAAVAVIIAFGAIYAFVHWKTGSLESSLAREDAALREIRDALDEMQRGLPQLISATEKARDSRLRAQQTFANIATELKPQEAELLVLANRSAAADLELALSNLSAATEILANLQAVQESLEANQADLRKLLVNGPQPKAIADAGRVTVTARCKRIDDLMGVAERFTSDLSQFVLKEEQHWLELRNQMANLQAAANGDPDLAERFKVIELLEKLSGTAIEHSRKIEAFLENVPKKQVEVERSQQGFLSTLE